MLPYVGLAWFRSIFVTVQTLAHVFLVKWEIAQNLWEQCFRSKYENGHEEKCHAFLPQSE
jgi:hypothetical protein